MRYFLLVNPRAKKRFPRELAELIACAKRSEKILDVAEAKDAEDFIELAEQVIQVGYDYLLIFGGDGSLHLAAQSFGRHPGAKTVLVALPFGTGNDFYRGLNANTKRSGLHWIFEKPETKSMSLGLVQWEGGYRFFLNSFSLGITPRIIDHFEKSRWRNYLIACINALPGYEAIKVNQKETLLFMVCKGPFAGAGMRFHPDAAHEKVKVLWIPRLSLGSAIRYLPALYSSGLAAVPQVTAEDFIAMDVEIGESEAKIEADGEIISVGSRIGIEIVPDVLMVAYFTKA